MKHTPVSPRYYANRMHQLRTQQMHKSGTCGCDLAAGFGKAPVPAPEKALASGGGAAPAGVTAHAPAPVLTRMSADTCCACPVYTCVQSRVNAKHIFDAGAGEMKSAARVAVAALLVCAALFSNVSVYGMGAAAGKALGKELGEALGRELGESLSKSAGEAFGREVGETLRPNLEVFKFEFEVKPDLRVEERVKIEGEVREKFKGFKEGLEGDVKVLRDAKKLTSEKFGEVIEARMKTLRERIIREHGKSIQGGGDAFKKSFDGVMEGLKLKEQIDLAMQQHASLEAPRPRVSTPEEIAGTGGRVAEPVPGSAAEVKTAEAAAEVGGPRNATQPGGRLENPGDLFSTETHKGILEATAEKFKTEGVLKTTGKWVANTAYMIGMGAIGALGFMSISWLQSWDAANRSHAAQKDLYTNAQNFGNLNLRLCDGCFNEANPMQSVFLYQLEDEGDNPSHIFVASGSRYGSSCYQSWGTTGMVSQDFAYQMIDVATGKEFDGSGVDVDKFPRQLDGIAGPNNVDLYYGLLSYNACPTTMKKFSQILAARLKGTPSQTSYDPGLLAGNTAHPGGRHDFGGHLEELSNRLYKKEGDTSIIDGSMRTLNALTSFTVPTATGANVRKMTLRPFKALTATKEALQTATPSLASMSEFVSYDPAKIKAPASAQKSLPGVKPEGNLMAYGVSVYQTQDTPLMLTLPAEKRVDLHDYVVTLDENQNIVPGYAPIIAGGTVSWAANPGVQYAYSLIDGAMYDLRNKDAVVEKDLQKFAPSGQGTNEQLLFAKYISVSGGGMFGGGSSAPSQDSTLFGGNMGRQIVIVRKIIEEAQAQAAMSVGGYLLTPASIDQGAYVYMIDPTNQALKNSTLVIGKDAQDKDIYATDYVVPLDKTLKPMALGAGKAVHYLASLVSSQIYKVDKNNLSVAADSWTFALYNGGNGSIAAHENPGKGYVKNKAACNNALSTTLGGFYQEAAINPFNKDTARAGQVKAARALIAKGANSARAYADNCLIPFGPLFIYKNLPWGNRGDSIDKGVPGSIADAIQAAHAAWIGNKGDTPSAGPFAFTTMLVPNIFLSATSSDDLGKKIYVYKANRYPGDYFGVSSSETPSTMEPFNIFDPQKFMISLKTGMVYKRNTDTTDTDYYGTVSILDKRANVDAIIKDIKSKNGILGNAIQKEIKTGVNMQGPFVLALVEDDAKNKAYIYQSLEGVSKQNVDDVLHGVIADTQKADNIRVIDYLVGAKAKESGLYLKTYTFNVPLEKNPEFLVSVITGNFYNAKDGATADASLDLGTDQNPATYLIKQIGGRGKVSEATIAGIDARALAVIQKPGAGAGAKPEKPADPLAKYSLKTSIINLIDGDKLIVPVFANLRFADGTIYSVSPDASAAIKSALDYKNGVFFVSTQDSSEVSPVTQYVGELLKDMRHSSGIADPFEIGLHVPQPVISFNWAGTQELQDKSGTKAKHFKYPDETVTLKFGEDGYYGSLPGSYNLNTYKHTNGGYGIMADYVSSVQGEAGARYWIDMYSGNRFAYSEAQCKTHNAEYPAYLEQLSKDKIAAKPAAVKSAKIIALSGYDANFNPRAVLAPAPGDENTYYLWRYNGAHGSYTIGKEDRVRFQQEDKVLLLGPTFASGAIKKYFNPDPTKPLGVSWGSGGSDDTSVSGVSDTRAFAKAGAAETERSETVRFYTYIGSDISGSAKPPAFSKQCVDDASKDAAGWLLGVDSYRNTLAGEPHAFMVAGTGSGDAWKPTRVFVPLATISKNASDVDAYAEFIALDGPNKGEMTFKPGYDYADVDAETRLTLVINLTDARTTAPYVVLSVPKSQDGSSSAARGNAQNVANMQKTHHYFIPDAEIVEWNTLFAVQKKLGKYVALTAYGDLLLFDSATKASLKPIEVALGVPNDGTSHEIVDRLIKSGCIVKEEIAGGEKDGKFGRYLFNYKNGSGFIEDEKNKLYYRSVEYVDLRTGVLYREDFDDKAKIIPTGAGLSLVELQMLLRDLGISVPGVPFFAQTWNNKTNRLETGKTYSYDNVSATELADDVTAYPEISDKAAGADIPFVRYAAQKSSDSSR